MRTYNTHGYAFSVLLLFLVTAFAECMSADRLLKWTSHASYSIIKCHPNANTVINMTRIEMYYTNQCLKCSLGAAVGDTPRLQDVEHFLLVHLALPPQRIPFAFCLMLLMFSEASHLSFRGQTHMQSCI